MGIICATLIIGQLKIISSIMQILINVSHVVVLFRKEGSSFISVADFQMAVLARRLYDSPKLGV